MDSMNVCLDFQKDHISYSLRSLEDLFDKVSPKGSSKTRATIWAASTAAATCACWTESECPDSQRVGEVSYHVETAGRS